MPSILKHVHIHLVYLIVTVLWHIIYQLIFAGKENEAPGDYRKDSMDFQTGLARLQVWFIPTTLHEKP